MCKYTVYIYRRKFPHWFKALPLWANFKGMKEVSKAIYLADILSLHQHPTVETTQECLGVNGAKKAKQSLGFIQVSLVLQIPFQEY